MIRVNGLGLRGLRGLGGGDQTIATLQVGLNVALAAMGGPLQFPVGGAYQPTLVVDGVVGPNTLQAATYVANKMALAPGAQGDINNFVAAPGYATLAACAKTFIGDLQATYGSFSTGGQWSPSSPAPVASTSDSSGGSVVITPVAQASTDNGALAVGDSKLARGIKWGALILAGLVGADMLWKKRKSRRA